MLIKKLFISLFLCSIAIGRPFVLIESTISPIVGKNTYRLSCAEPNRIAITIGNEKVETEFRAHVKMEFWAEDSISFCEEGVVGVPTLVGDKIKLELSDCKHEWYQQKYFPNPSNQDKWRSLLKWVHTLKEKPISNIWTLKLSGGYADFNFYYQKPLSVEALDFPGSTVQYFERDGRLWVKLVHPMGDPIEYDARPLEVDGSYAVYHKSKKHHVKGKKNYRTGKVLHIYRPKAIDVDGKWTWCELNIENDIYARTIPQKFLDEAVYPIVINDTFGYTTIGGSDSSLGADYMVGTGGTANFQPASNGSATSVSWHTALQVPFTMGIYSDDGASYPDTLLKDTASENSTAGDWSTLNLDSALSITSGTPYWIAENHDNSSVVLKYDGNTGSFVKYYVSTYSAGNLDNPFTDGASSLEREYSAYATYTPSGAAAPQVIIINMD